MNGFFFIGKIVLIHGRGYQSLRYCTKMIFLVLYNGSPLKETTLRFRSAFAPCTEFLYLEQRVLTHRNRICWLVMVQSYEGHLSALTVNFETSQSHGISLCKNNFTCKLLL